MKKTLSFLVLAAALFCATPVRSQFEFGIRAGVDQNKIHGLGLDVKNENHAGYFIGPVAAYTFPALGVGADIAAFFDHRENNLNDHKVNQNTILMPVNVRYTVGLGSLLNVFAFTGPQFEWFVGDKNDVWDTHQSVSSNWQTTRSKFQLQKSNLSWNLGAGATLLKHLQATVTYNISMGRTSEYSETKIINGVEDIVKKGKGKNNTWQIGFAYLF